MMASETYPLLSLSIMALVRSSLNTLVKCLSQSPTSMLISPLS